MKKKNALYRAYLEQKHEGKNRKKILKKYNISGDDNTIIINKRRSLLNTIVAIISKLFKVMVYVILFILISLGTTVLINEELRNMVIEILRLNI